MEKPENNVLISWLREALGEFKDDVKEEFRQTRLEMKDRIESEGKKREVLAVRVEALEKWKTAIGVFVATVAAVYLGMRYIPPVIL